METKYATPFFYLHHLFHLLDLPDLSSSWAFPFLLSVLLSSIILVIIVYYLRIITMKKLINLDRLIYCYCHAYVVFIDLLITRAGPSFDLICIIYKSSFRIL